MELCATGPPYNLFKTHCGNWSVASFFGNHVINVWNSVTPDVNFSSINKFKTSLQSVDLSSFLRCNCNKVHLNYVTCIV